MYISWILDRSREWLKMFERWKIESDDPSSSSRFSANAIIIMEGQQSSPLPAHGSAQD